MKPTIEHQMLSAVEFELTRYTIANACAEIAKIEMQRNAIEFVKWATKEWLYNSANDLWFNRDLMYIIKSDEEIYALFIKETQTPKP